MSDVPQSLFSVVVPTWNRAQRLRRTLESLARQTFAGFEVIVVDDGSTDDTATVVDDLSRAGGLRSLTYLRQEHQGATAARNRGAQAARFDYLLFLDSDDEALAEWLEELAREAGSDVALIFCGGAFFDEREKHLRSELPSGLGPLFNNWVGKFTSGSFAVRREVFWAVGGYQASLRSSQHSELAFRLVDYCDAQALRSAIVARVLLRYHRHEEPRIQNSSSQILAGVRYLLEHHEQRIRRHPGTYAEYLAIAGTQAARLGEWELARGFLARAVLAQPLRSWKPWARLGAALMPTIGRRVFGAGRREP